MENVQKISIDIMNNKYSDYIYAKQYDRNRVVNFTITENGKKKSLDGTFCTFLMKGKQYTSYETLTKNQDIFKLIVTSKETREAGKIPYQLLLTSGQIEIIDGQIHWLEEGTIIGTVTGYILVEPCVIDKDELEDQYDEGIIDQLFAAIAATGDVVAEAEELCEKADKDAVKSQSYAIGGTESRTGEDTDNSKYYSEQANASSTLSQSYAVGGTNTREGEDEDNAKYYSEQAEHAKDLVIITKKVTLLATGEGSWNRSTNTITVPCDGITDNEDEQLIVVRPYEQYIEEYLSCNIRCIAQGDGTLTFKCDTIPSRNIDVHVNNQMLVIDNEAQSRIIYTNIEPESGEINTGDYWVCDYPPDTDCKIAGGAGEYLGINTWTTYSVPENFRDFSSLRFKFYKHVGTIRNIDISKAKSEIATYTSDMNFEDATLVYNDTSYSYYHIYIAIDSDSSNVRIYADTDVHTDVIMGVVTHAI